MHPRSVVDVIQDGPFGRDSTWNRHKRKILRVLIEVGPMKRRHIVEIVGVCESSTSRLLGELTEEGLVARRGNTRALWYSVTRHGVKSVRHFEKSRVEE